MTFSDKKGFLSLTQVTKLFPIRLAGLTLPETMAEGVGCSHDLGGASQSEIGGQSLPVTEKVLERSGYKDETSNSSLLGLEWLGATNFLGEQ